MSASNLLTNQIISTIKGAGGAARRVNVTGLPDGKGGYRKGGMKRGYEDVDATVPVKLGNGKKFGLKVAIEVKIGNDTQKSEQRNRQLEVEEAGGIYLIAKEYDQFVRDLKKLINEKIQ